MNDDQRKDEFLRKLALLTIEYGVDFDVMETSRDGFGQGTHMLKITDRFGNVYFDGPEFDDRDAKEILGV